MENALISGPLFACSMRIRCLLPYIKQSGRSFGWMFIISLRQSRVRSLSSLSYNLLHTFSSVRSHDTKNLNIDSVCALLRAEKQCQIPPVRLLLLCSVRRVSNGFSCLFLTTHGNHWPHIWISSYIVATSVAEAVEHKKRTLSSIRARITMQQAKSLYNLHLKGKNIIATKQGWLTLFPEFVWVYMGGLEICVARPGVPLWRAITQLCWGWRYLHPSPMIVRQCAQISVLCFVFTDKSNWA